MNEVITMLKNMMGVVLVTILLGSVSQADAGKAVQEELTCGIVVDVKKTEQRVILKPLTGTGQLEGTLVSRMVLPESLNIAQVIKGNQRMKFCVQMPIAQGGRYKTWATVHKSASGRLSTLE